jgi:hypothetical protein
MLAKINFLSKSFSMGIGKERKKEEKVSQTEHVNIKRGKCSRHFLSCKSIKYSQF